MQVPSRQRLLRMVLGGRALTGLRRALLRGYCPHLAQIEASRSQVRDGSGLDDDYWAQQLRRSAHMLDKGLRSPDCAAGRGLAARASAGLALQRIRDHETLCDPSIQWAIAIVHEHDLMQSSGTPRPGGADSAPDGSQGRKLTEFSWLRGVMTSRRSVRNYEHASVRLDELEDIAEAAVWAPSSCNRQTVKLFMTDEPGRAAECLRQCAGATCFGDFIPAFVAFCADLRSYALPGEMFVPALDVGLCAQNACLAAHALGLSLTLLSWAQHSEQEAQRLSALLDIPASHQVVVCGALGYPRGPAGPAPARKGPGRGCSVVSEPLDVTSPGGMEGSA